MSDITFPVPGCVACEALRLAYADGSAYYGEASQHMALHGVGNHPILHYMTTQVVAGAEQITREAAAKGS